MDALINYLREEHDHVRPQVEEIREVADAVGTLDLDRLREKVLAVRSFLQGKLLPHARTEEQVIYPMLARLTGSPESMAAMRRDHAEIGRLARMLDEPDGVPARFGLSLRQANRLRAALYGLHAVIALHFAKEDGIYVPYLARRLSPRESHPLFTAMVTCSWENRLRAAPPA